jgi:hypothetical protein
MVLSDYLRDKYNESCFFDAIFLRLNNSRLNSRVSNLPHACSGSLSFDASCVFPTVYPLLPFLTTSPRQVKGNFIVHYLRSDCSWDSPFREIARKISKEIQLRDGSIMRDIDIENPRSKSTHLPCRCRSRRREKHGARCDVGDDAEWTEARTS